MNISKESISVVDGLFFLNQNQIDQINALPNNIFTTACSSFGESFFKESFFLFLTDFSNNDEDLIVLKKRALFILNSILKNKEANIFSTAYKNGKNLNSNFLLPYSASSVAISFVYYTVLLSAYLVYYASISDKYTQESDKEFVLINQRKAKATTAEQDALERFVENGGSVADQYKVFISDAEKIDVTFKRFFNNSEQKQLEFSEILFDEKYQKLAISHYQFAVTGGFEEKLSRLFGFEFNHNVLREFFAIQSIYNDFDLGFKGITLPLTTSEFSLFSTNFLSAYGFFYEITLANQDRVSNPLILNNIKSKSNFLKNMQQYFKNLNSLPKAS